MAIKQYKGIQVTVVKRTVTESDIDQQLAILLAQNPVRESKEGPAAMGDTCAIDYKGCKDGVPFEGGTGSFDLELGSGSFIPGFEEQMVGMMKGETRDLNLTFPEKYHAPELAGAAVVFTVTVNDIFTQKPAELTDAFVAQFQRPGINTVEDLKNYFRVNFERQTEEENRRMAEEAVMSVLIEENDITPDPERVEAAIQGQITNLNNTMEQQGASLEQYLEMTGMSLEVIKDQLRGDAEKQVKLEAALTEVADLESITITAEELEAHYQEIADYYGLQVEQVKDELKAEVVTGDLRCRKAHNLIMENAQVTFADPE